MIELGPNSIGTKFYSYEIKRPGLFRRILKCALLFIVKIRKRLTRTESPK